MQVYTHTHLYVFLIGAMDELHSLDPRRQELLEARFTGVASGSTGSTGSCSVGAKVSTALACVQVISGTYAKQQLITYWNFYDYEKVGKNNSWCT